MAVNSCAFVKPAVAEAGVHAHDYVILATVVGEVTEVEAKRRVAVVVAAQEVSVYEDQGVTEGTVEFEDQAAAAIAFRNVEAAAVPAHTGLGIASAQRFISVTLKTFITNKWQLDCPVVRQVEGAPLGIVEFLSGKFKIAGLGKIVLLAAKPQVTRRIAAVAELKLPSKVKEKMIARGDRG